MADGAPDLMKSIREAYVKAGEDLPPPEDEDKDGGEGGKPADGDTDSDDIEDGDNDEGSPQETPAQLEAREQGWMPLEEWEEAGNDPDLWKPAGAFLQDGEFRKEMRGLKRGLKKRDKVIDSLVKERDQTYKAGYDAAIRDLKKQRKEAAEDGDMARVLEISDEIDEVKEKASKAPKLEGVKDADDDEGGDAEFTPKQERELKKFAVRNPWYMTNQRMQSYADVVAEQYMEDNEDADVVEALQHAEKIVRQQFPVMFKGQRQQRSATDRGGQPPASPKEPRVLQPRELVNMEDGEMMHGIYKNYKAANMFVSKDNPKGALGKTYEEWARSVGAVKE